MDDSFHLGPDGIYRCRALQRFVWQSHGFGTRCANPDALTLRQVHSDIVWNAHGLTDREQEGDALITNDIGLSIGIRTADCVPILLLDTKHRAVAAIHAGWRGTAAGIVSCAIRKMSEMFHSPPIDLFAAIGPCIRQCCYEVGSEVAEQFHPAFRTAKLDNKFDLNLPAAAISQLSAAGILEASIFDSGLCTSCQIEILYSYRRQPGETGRMVSAITRLY